MTTIDISGGHSLGPSSHAERKVIDLIYLLVAASLLVRVLLVSDAILVGDEYYYAKTAELWFHGNQWTGAITNMPNRGEAKLPNSLFFFIYQWTYCFGDNFYVAAKFFNVIFALLTNLAVIKVAVRFVDKPTALVIGCIALWLPSTSYLTYFMPEALYECFVWWSFAGFLQFCTSAPRRATAQFGALLGISLLAKPNSIAVLAAANGVVLVAAISTSPVRLPWRAVAARLLLLNLSFFGAAYFVNLLVTQRLFWDPVGDFYRNSLAKIAEVDGHLSFLKPTVKYASAYALVIATIFGPALIVEARRGIRDSLPAEGRILQAVSIFGMSALLLGSVKVAVNWERVYINHSGVYSSRYMSALFPLLIISFLYSCRELSKSSLHRGRWSAVLLCIFAAVTGILHAHMFNPLQMHETHWMKDWSGAVSPVYWIQLAAFIGLTAYYGFSAKPSRTPYLALLVVWSVASTSWLIHKDTLDGAPDGQRNYGEAARGVRALVKPEFRTSGIVIADEQAYAARFMFRYPGIVPMALTRDSPINPADPIPAGKAWAVFLGDSLEMLKPQCIGLPGAALCFRSRDVVY